ncbi:caspase family protein [Actinomadura sp. HBU206391]|uniref:caspase family protein n=1 Tax=Actinomadura sp. HBU206391 TaxID=2731692 RepID=UPI00164F0CEE|nr:caspase family protein [Actinomadura sp. HBU206391]MBC6460839.1 caspase family protein [Actinomadura sp. HBU206391]
MRRALSAGVGSFPDEDRDLPYASELAEELRTALAELDYTCSEPVPLTAENLGTAVHGQLETGTAGDVLVVHVITHGEVSESTGKLYVIGADGVHHRLTDVETWLASVEDHADRPLTLFLLDICQAGEAARLPWQGRLADGSARAWVIGACAPGQAAFDGRLTRAVVNVLTALRQGELDIDPALRHAPFTAVARAIGLEVKRLTEESDGISQQVTGTLVDVTAAVPELPFFPNPAYPPSPSRQARAEVDAAVGPFLDDVDEALDPGHFYERASGRRTTDRTAAGCFSGRRKELRELVPWLHGYGSGGLRVVTGSPGVGKSALLGVLVCAAHPRLRKATKGVWDRIEQAPWQLDHLAAVHARQRSTSEIVTSLARQLGLPSAAEPEPLIESLAALPDVPVIVLDALDEANRPAEVMEELLLPLAAAVRSGGAAACRLLVGTRRWGFDALLDLAREADALIDLDEVDRDVLRGELETYVYELLGAHPAYRDLGAVRGAFATEVAKALGAPPEQGEERWGEFLVAGLFTHHFTGGEERPVADPVRAAEVGATVPRTLPQVFDLDLRGRAETPFLRPVLAGLARARGEGMPADLARRYMELDLGQGNGADALSGRRINAALEAGRFYLRRASDTDGTMLYRLFHAGLAEHLRNQFDQRPGAQREDQILTAMLEPINGPAGRRWDLAEPYTRRHAVEHALAAGRLGELVTDPEFFIHAEAPIQTVETVLSGPSAPTQFSALPSRLLPHPVELDRMPPERRRTVLALAAARQGLTELAERIVNPPGRPALAWQPRWSAGSPDPEFDRIAGDPQDRTATESPGTGHREEARRADPLIAVSGGDDGTIRIWNPPAGQLGNELTSGSGRADGRPDPVLAVAVGELDGRPIAVTGSFDKTVRIWDLTTRELLGEPLTGHTGPVHAVAIGRLHDRDVAVTGSMDTTVRVWDLRTGEPVGKPLTGHTDTIRAVSVAEVNGRTIAVTGSLDMSVRVWDLGDDRLSSRPLTGHTGAVHTVAIGQVDGRAVAVTGSQDTDIRVWDLTDHTASGYPLTHYRRPVYAVAVGESGGRTVAVIGSGDATVQVWDLSTRERVGEPITGHTGPVWAVALDELDGRPIAVTGGQDKTVRVWDLTTGSPVGEPLTGHRKAVYAVATAWRCRGSSGGRPAAGDGPAAWLPDPGGPTVHAVSAIVGTDEGPVAVVADGAGEVTARDLATGAVLDVLSAGADEITHINGAHSEGRRVVALHRARGLGWLWDVAAGVLTVGDSPQPSAAAEIRARRYVDVVCDGRPIRVIGTLTGGLERHDLATDLPLEARPDGHRGPVTALTATRVGGRATVLTGAADGTVRIWDVATGRQTDVVDVPGAVVSLHTSTDGHLLVAAGQQVICFRQAVFVRRERAARPEREESR